MMRKPSCLISCSHNAVIGSLFGASAAEWADNIAGFRRGLAEVDFVEGRNSV